MGSMMRHEVKLSEDHPGDTITNACYRDRQHQGKAECEHEAPALLQHTGEGSQIYRFQSYALNKASPTAMKYVVLKKK